MSDKRRAMKAAGRLALALIPVVTLTACTGSAPTAPSDPLASGEPGDVTAMTVPGSCRAITRIDLRLVDESRTYVWVEATYQFVGSGLARCAAPLWSSDRRGMVVDPQNPFRAGFLRSARGIAVLTAQAPNGVHGSIRLNLGPDETCRNIVGVQLKLLGSGDDNIVWIQATYLYPGDSPEGCEEPPAFTATRRGLRTHPRDAFRAGIPNAPDIPTTVTALAPNGIGNRITF